MSTPLISEILNNVKKIPKKIDKINYLRNNFSVALGEIIKYGITPVVKMYTDKLPPHKPDTAPEGLNMSSLYSEYKRLYIFLDKELEYLKTRSITKDDRKQVLLIQFLESIHPSEIEVIKSIFERNFDKKYGLDIDFVKEALPGLIS